MENVGYSKCSSNFFTQSEGNSCELRKKKRIMRFKSGRFKKRACVSSWNAV